MKYYDIQIHVLRLNLTWRRHVFLFKNNNFIQRECIFKDENNSLDIIDKFWFPQKVIFNLYNQLNISLQHLSKRIHPVCFMQAMIAFNFMLLALFKAHVVTPLWSCAIPFCSLSNALCFRETLRTTFSKLNLQIAIIFIHIRDDFFRYFLLGKGDSGVLC